MANKKRILYSQRHNTKVNTQERGNQSMKRTEIRFESIECSCGYSGIPLGIYCARAFKNIKLVVVQDAKMVRKSIYVFRYWKREEGWFQV
jgi:hypothetical protein